jgi:hypothetical protein
MMSNVLREQPEICSANILKYTAPLGPCTWLPNPPFAISHRPWTRTRISLPTLRDTGFVANQRILGLGNVPQKTSNEKFWVRMVESSRVEARMV